MGSALAGAATFGFAAPEEAVIREEQVQAAPCDLGRETGRCTLVDRIETARPGMMMVHFQITHAEAHRSSKCTGEPEPTQGGYVIASCRPEAIEPPSDQERDAYDHRVYFDVPFDEPTPFAKPLESTVNMSEACARDTKGKVRMLLQVAPPRCGAWSTDDPIKVTIAVRR
jgi:hypothetical protein